MTLKKTKRLEALRCASNCDGQNLGHVMKSQNALWMAAWGLYGLFNIVAAAGAGCLTIAISATACGFMFARAM